MEKHFLFIGIIALLSGIVLQSGYFIKGPDDDLPPHIFDTFRYYVVEFDKEYSTPEERSYRLHVFYANTLKLLAFQDDKEADYTLGYTIFSDFTQEEYQQTYLMTTPRHISNELGHQIRELDTSDLLETKDWRQWRGLIREVFFQQKCASQWATSVVDAANAQFFRARYTPPFSIQQILDCTSDGQWNQGCKGGSHADAAKWILENGVAYEKDYPYQAIQNPKCKIVGGAKPSFFSVKKDTTGAQLKAAVNLSPVSVCFNASQLAFYVKGPVNKNTEGPVNSCGLLVGYDADGWIIQQSFGTQWGDDGYLHIAFSNVASGIYDSGFYADK